ncbi:MAG TPA: POTRA domain-containing protein [Bryobacteraceae bacterium]|nr:POTRA domain-containing protein [Bryobacteraceae bacterium]
MLGILLLSVLSLRGSELAGQRISEVAGVPPSVALETRAGGLFDPVKLQHDVHTLWRTGRVSDVQVEAVPDAGSVRVIFHLRPKATVRVRKIQMDPPTPGVRLRLQPGAEMDLQDAQQVAAGVVKQLEASGYANAEADAQLAPTGTGAADLKIHINKQRPIDVRSVNVSGDLGMNAADVYGALRATRAKTMVPGIPGIWKGWRVRPGYSSDAVQSDLANLRSFYYRGGYFDADVRVASIDLTAGEAHIGYAVQAGPKYQVAMLNGVPLPGAPDRPGDAVCRELFDERRAAERAGVLDFAARVEIHGAGPTVEAIAGITQGPAYRTGRIEFRGNRRERDETLRRMLLLEEGGPLDQLLLRQSLARLNRTGWFEPVTARAVVLNPAPEAGRADVQILLKERQTRNWYLSGPVGPMSLGGSLHAAIESRLPAWGQGVFELSTYTLSLNLMLFAKPLGALVPFLPNRRFLPLLTLNRPILPGQRLLSGFTIAPQLGWQGMLAGYAASQTRAFLAGLLQTEPGLTPDLLLTVSHEEHGGTLRCEPPKPRFDRMRQIAAAAVNLLFSFSPL